MRINITQKDTSRTILLAEIPSGTVFEGKIGGGDSALYLKIGNSSVVNYEIYLCQQYARGVEVTGYVPHLDTELVVK